MNNVYLIGNLTRDPELRQISDRYTVAELGVAVNERYRNKEGESVDKTCFVDIVVWNGQAKACAEYLKKGAPVMVTGKLQLDQWKDKNGENHSRLRVRADRVEFMQKRQKPEGAEQAA